MFVGCLTVSQRLSIGTVPVGGTSLNIVLINVVLQSDRSLDVLRLLAHDVKAVPLHVVAIWREPEDCIPVSPVATVHLRRLNNLPTVVSFIVGFTLGDTHDLIIVSKLAVDRRDLPLCHRVLNNLTIVADEVNVVDVILVVEVLITADEVFTF